MTTYFMTYDPRALKRLMKKYDVKPQALADLTGLTTQGIYTLARGAGEPRASTLGRLASALDVKLEAFFIVKGVKS